MEIYSDRKGNLTAKMFYKTRKDASQRVMDIEKSLLPTSETYFGAILSDTKIPQMLETSSVDNDTFDNPDIRLRSIAADNRTADYALDAIEQATADRTKKRLCPARDTISLL